MKDDSLISSQPETWCAQALGFVDTTTGAVVPPIHPSSTYARDEDNVLISGRLYSRADNPNYDPVEALLTRLEQGRDAALFSSGNAAAAAIFQNLRPGDRVLIPQVMYWALRGWVVSQAVPWGLVVDVVDMTDLAQVEQALQQAPTRMVWVETPANPTLDVTDIAAVAELAHAAGAMLVVDSSFASPVLTRPLQLGADLVMHSATKYLNGHSDVVAGVVITAEKDDFWESLKRVRFQAGAVLGPFEAWLLLRGLRTLPLRVRAQSEGALAVARHFSSHPAVEQVFYPGLPDFPGHEIAKRQMQGGFGGMLSMRIKGGQEEALRCVKRCGLWKRATSLGGVESLVEHRATTEGPDSPTARDLLRFSTGIEAPTDLIRDLEQALKG